MKPSPCRSALLVAACFLIAASAAASPVLDISVKTDKASYGPGEPVRILITGRNAGTEPLWVSFPSGYTFDYVLDDTYVWSAGMAFTQAPISFTMKPGEETTFLEDLHDADAYPLRQGRHQVVGEVVKYGKATAVFEVQGDSSGLQISAGVEPRSAPPGTPLEFSMTAANVTAEPLRFSTGGCVVLYEIHTPADEDYFPMVACPAVLRQFDLDPGKSLTFAPPEYGHLRFDPWQFPLAPGRHIGLVTLEGVASDRVAFDVLPPSNGLAYLGGRALRSNGAPVPEGIATLTTSPGPPTRPPTSQTYSVRISNEGWFYFMGIQPGAYYLRVDVGDQSQWYPGGPDSANLAPLALRPNSYRGDIRFTFRFPEPPPPGPFNIYGEVHANAFLPDPVAGALVMAVPADVDPATGTSAADLIGRSSFTTRTGRDGSFHLSVPAGTYRLVAGNPGAHRYQYWDHASRFEEATLVTGPPVGKSPERFYRFDLVPSEGTPPARIAGIVWSDDPNLDRPSMPIAGAQVLAIPLLRGDGFDSTRYAPYRAETGEDGSYVLEVPGDAPYLVMAQARGHEPQYYRGAARAEDAAWVDTAPGEGIRGIHFSLRPQRPDSGQGTIEGVAVREVPFEECVGNARPCVVPAAGAVVVVTPAFPTFAAVEYRATVGRDGRFRVEGLWAAEDGSLSYYVSVLFRGYEPALYPGGVPWEAAEPLPVYPGRAADAGKILLHLAKPEAPGFVFGQVLATGNDAPIAGALVRVYLQPEEPRGKTLETRTEDDGSFRVAGLSEGASVLVSAEAPGFVPAYNPAVHRWRDSEPVIAAGPHMRVAGAVLHLLAAASDGPYLQAGRVRVAGDVTEPAPAMKTARDARAMALAYHEQNLPGAFFFLEDPRTDAFPPIPLAGGSSGSNGAVILTGLPAGSYVAVADRPGFAPAYFSDGTGVPVWITLDATTPAVLADIALAPAGAGSDSSGEDLALPMVRELSNVPNPFTAETRIQYALAEPAEVTLDVFDARGRLVREILTRAPQDAGRYEIPWDRTSATGDRVSAGVYFVCVRAGQSVSAQKVVILP